MKKLQVYIETITNKQFEHCYNLIKIGNDIILDFEDSENVKYSKAIGSILDDGDGLIIKLDDRESIELNYAEAQQLLIMLAMHEESEIQFRESKTIKTI